MDDIWLIANREQDLQKVINEMEACMDEYGMKVSQGKSKVVCINCETGNGR